MIIKFQKVATTLTFQGQIIELTGWEKEYMDTKFCYFKTSFSYDTKMGKNYDAVGYADY